MIKGIIALNDRFTAGVTQAGHVERLQLLDEMPEVRLSRMAEAEGFTVHTPAEADANAQYLVISADLVMLSEGEFEPMIESEAPFFHDIKGNFCAARLTGAQLHGLMSKGEPCDREGKACRPTAFECVEESFKLTRLSAPERVGDVSVRGIRIMDFVDQSDALSRLREKSAADWMAAGVRIDDPKLTAIGVNVRIGAGTHLIGQVRLDGRTVIGEGVTIIDSHIGDSTIGNGVRIDHAVIESAVMEDGSNIGPYAHLRPKAHLGRNVHIGNFVEVKNATMGEGTKAGHLAYIGDADIGSGVNVGCGVVFVNYDGKRKHRSVIEDGAFLGSNANIVAPVHVEPEGYIAAGSTITDDVDAGALAIERAEQRVISGYVAKRKAKGTL